MDEFTKGEWTVPLWTRRDGNNRCWVMRGKISICRCFGKPKTAEANAHLIAAAPDLKQQRDDLLAACKYLIRVIMRNEPRGGSISKEAVELAIAAISKAKSS